MPGGVLVRTVVFDQGLYRGNGDVHRWCRKITDRFEREATHYAPIRSGELVAGISAETHQVGVRQVQGTIQSSAKHTMFVLRGTTGPIMTNRGFANPEGSVVFLWKDLVSRSGRKYRERVPVRQKGFWMPLPAHEGFARGFADVVSGQEANNFFERAWRATARDHRAIRGKGIPEFIRNP